MIDDRSCEPLNACMTTGQCWTHSYETPPEEIAKAVSSSIFNILKNNNDKLYITLSKQDLLRWARMLVANI